MSGGGAGITMVCGCHTGQHLKMLVKHAPSFCIAVEKNLALATVNAVELESVVPPCANVKVAV